MRRTHAAVVLVLVVTSCGEQMPEVRFRGWSVPAHTTDDALEIRYGGVPLPDKFRKDGVVLVTPIGIIECRGQQWAFLGGVKKSAGRLASEFAEGAMSASATKSGFYAAPPDGMAPWDSVCLRGTPEDWVYIYRKDDSGRVIGFWCSPEKLAELPW